MFYRMYQDYLGGCMNMMRMVGQCGSVFLYDYQLTPRAEVSTFESSNHQSHRRCTLYQSTPTAISAAHNLEEHLHRPSPSSSQLASRSTTTPSEQVTVARQMEPRLRAQHISYLARTKKVEQVAQLVD